MRFPNYIFIDDSSIEFATVDNVLRSDIEVGPVKTRPIQSRPMFNVKFDVSVCDEDFPKFKTWFASVKYGAYWFFMNHPLTGVNTKVRFLETQLTWSKVGSLFQSEFTLEGYDD